jgi:hypothetical protein
VTGTVEEPLFLSYTTMKNLRTIKTGKRTAINRFSRK